MRGAERFRLLAFRFRFDECAGFVEVKLVLSRAFRRYICVFVCLLVSFGRFLLCLTCGVSKDHQQFYRLLEI